MQTNSGTPSVPAGGFAFRRQRIAGLLLSFGPLPAMDDGAKMAVGKGQCWLFLSNRRLIANMIEARVLESQPNFKIISVESGVG